MIQKFYIVALGGAREKHDLFLGKVKLFSSLNSGSGKLNTVKIDLLFFFLTQIGSIWKTQVLFSKFKKYLKFQWIILYNIMKIIRLNTPFQFK